MGLLRREREHRVVHVERPSDIGSYQLRVRNTGALGKSVSEQADTKAAVQILRIRGFRSTVTHKKLMQCDAVIIGKRIVGIFGLEVVGNAGKPRAMSREVEQGDFCRRRSGIDVGEKDRAHRLVEPDFSLRRKLRKGKPGKGLGDRADLEDRIGACSAVSKHAPPAVVDYADRDSATGRFSEQAVLHDRCKLGVECILQIRERDRRSRRKFVGLRRRRRIDAP